MLWLCYKLPSGLFGHTRDTSVMLEKAKFVCFNYMQPQKVKFKSVQINMKHVSYSSCRFCNYIPRYEVYRGYIVFAFSVTMFVCLFTLGY